MDNDLLQEFIAESRELLTDAQSQLLRLEATPTDAAALSAIFRAFHTLKGGAGFLEAQNMVDWCHHLEDLLDKLRAQKLTADSSMIDAILRASDVVGRMLDEMASGENPTPGPAELGALVQAYARGDAPVKGQVSSSHPEPAAGSKPQRDPLTAQQTDKTWIEARFSESGQTVLHVENRRASEGSRLDVPSLKQVGSGEDDLEALFNQTLDRLYGKDNAPGASLSAAMAPSASHPPSPVTAPAAQASAVSSASGGHEATADTTMRVDSTRLDQAMNQVGELVLLRNRLSAAVARMDTEDESLVRMARETDLAVNDLQNTVMRLRMQPCKRLFQSLPRVVRDASRALGKKVRLDLRGEDVEIDKTVIDALSGPLIHLVRNALDHGLEPPAERMDSGKSEEGVLEVAAIHLGDKVQIRIHDDGRGMNPQKILQSALAKGVISAADAAHLSEREMLDLIFLPGFSTKEQVSELSGRGVGMDVVRSAVQALRGRVDIDTQPNQGTTLTLELPLTLAVLPVLYFRLRRETYALPVAVVDSLMEVDPAQIHSISGRLMAHVGKDRIVPYLDLGLHLQGRTLQLGKDDVEGILTEQGLLIVSEAIGTEDSVVKPLDISAQASWYQGATISGDGAVVLIVDPQALTRAIRTQQDGARMSATEALAYP
ncbi:MULTISPECIES: chemotaxis protein CheA [unclassified Thiomonas]|uniref:chemotaxis protein CheA n=1 Tax=unclassified Thiomonas TaxID=2625466 RepID=UPI0004DBA074|nr:MULTISPECIES: chemotaxis protein CheA [unclassified Thiomonas]CDW95012.1 putative Chemotaxis protein histidine kinase CheW [Thiomonas sp. CB2]VDY03925.1 CheA signal transduction histidine kinase [Thiomonas sp. Bio17B3]VDY08903.1 CheA signal transduction histidine kinase [Thiomonas sp. Sup16B3]VDY12171.1 putative Chemotaxis protein histidine kinase CheW [Thiomonas sp. OC7]VDY18614.1 putative Chemotaxis protein histidine kinase CheW [Thiomonas sp. CB2]